MRYVFVLFCKTCLGGCLSWHARCGILTHEYVNGIKTSYRRGERVRTFFKLLEFPLCQTVKADGFGYISLICTMQAYMDCYELCLVQNEKEIAEIFANRLKIDEIFVDMMMITDMITSGELRQRKEYEAKTPCGRKSNDNKLETHRLL